MLTVSLSSHCVAEARWTAETVFGTLLGIPYRVVEGREAGMALSMDGRTLHLPDAFFQGAEPHWLRQESLPRGPWSMWKVADALPELSDLVTDVPVLLGAAGFEHSAAGSGRLHLDVLGTVFLMLSRYEEQVRADRDGHGRFPLSAAIAHQASAHERPLADEYVEILWCAMRRVWPGLRKPAKAYGVNITCDVDHPYEGYTRSASKALRKAVGDMVKGRGAREAARTAMNALGTRLGVYRWDRYDSFEWMMDVIEAAGHRATFYFIAGKSDRRYDPSYDIGETRVRRLLRRIDERGHEIGIHGSYRSGESADVLASELMRLRTVVREEGIQQEIVPTRQHYLRWIPGTTAQLLDDLGLQRDSTLGFAESPGFRCGTSHEYAMYDVNGRRPLQIRQRPLLVMEDSVLSESYLGLDAGDAAYDCIVHAGTAARRFDGSFTLLWHNSTLNDATQRALYRRVVASEACHAA